jgi:hypothetical protein
MVMIAGLALANAQMSEWKLGVGGATNAANLGNYHMGHGATISVASERQFGLVDSRAGIRGNFNNFQAEGGATSPDFQQYGLGLETLVGPVAGFFQPKVGGHIGYVRLDNEVPGEDDNLDLGADAMLTLDITPNFDITALVSPTWLMNPDDIDYQTRGAVSVELALPGV